jgi:hypothetical protein
MPYHHCCVCSKSKTERKNKGSVLLCVDPDNRFRISNFVLKSAPERQAANEVDNKKEGGRVGAIAMMAKLHGKGRIPTTQ